MDPSLPTTDDAPPRRPDRATVDEAWSVSVDVLVDGRASESVVAAEEEQPAPAPPAATREPTWRPPWLALGTPAPAAAADTVRPDAPVEDGHAGTGRNGADGAEELAETSEPALAADTPPGPEAAGASFDEDEEPPAGPVQRGHGEVLLRAPSEEPAVTAAPLSEEALELTLAAFALALAAEPPTPSGLSWKVTDAEVPVGDVGLGAVPPSAGEPSPELTPGSDEEMPGPEGPSRWASAEDAPAPPGEEEALVVADPPLSTPPIQDEVEAEGPKVADPESGDPSGDTGMGHDVPAGGTVPVAAGSGADDDWDPLPGGSPAPEEEGPATGIWDASELWAGDDDPAPVSAPAAEPAPGDRRPDAAEGDRAGEDARFDLWELAGYGDEAVLLDRAGYEKGEDDDDRPRRSPRGVVGRRFVAPLAARWATLRRAERVNVVLYALTGVSILAMSLELLAGPDALPTDVTTTPTESVVRTVPVPNSTTTVTFTLPPVTEPPATDSPVVTEAPRRPTAPAPVAVDPEPVAPAPDPDPDPTPAPTTPSTAPPTTSPPRTTPTSFPNTFPTPVPPVPPSFPNAGSSAAVPEINPSTPDPQLGQ